MRLAANLSGTSALIAAVLDLNVILIAILALGAFVGHVLARRTTKRRGAPRGAPRA